MIISLFKDIQPLLLRRDRRQWSFLLVASLASGLSRSVFLAVVNGAIALRGDFQAIIPHTFAAFGLIAIMTMADYFGMVRGRYVSLAMALRLRNRLLDQIGSANLRFVEREKSARLHYHLIITIATITSAYSLFLVFCNGLTTLVFNLIYMAWLVPAGMLIALLVIFVGVWVHGRYERINQLRRPIIDECNNKIHGSHYGYLMGYKELRLSTKKAEAFRQVINEFNEGFLDESVRQARISAKGAAATNLFQYVAIAIVALALPVLINVEPTTAMQLLAAILFTIGPLTNVVSAFAGFGNARVALDNLKKLSASVEATREAEVEAEVADLPPFESLALRNVTFQFEPSAQLISPLDDNAPPLPKMQRMDEEEFRLGPLNLEIRRGEVVCIVGGNGSGKTVLMRLLAGLYRPQAGQILYNGKPLSTTARQAYRELFTAVFSDFFLFTELLGMDEPTQRKIESWLAKFDLKGKTHARNGVFTTTELSTGQRKRMALIVSILDNRPIMVLDEFSAEQDPEHRHLFYRTWLPELRAMGKTILVVSHDDRYFDAADRVIRMDFGQIVSDTSVGEASRHTSDATLGTFE
jgi:putative ATP-binding cassette transporter